MQLEVSLLANWITQREISVLLQPAVKENLNYEPKKSCCTAVLNLRAKTTFSSSPSDLPLQLPSHCQGQLSALQIPSSALSSPANWIHVPKKVQELPDNPASDFVRKPPNNCPIILKSHSNHIYLSVQSPSETAPGFQLSKLSIK